MILARIKSLKRNRVEDEEKECTKLFNKALELFSGPGMDKYKSSVANCKQNMSNCYHQFAFESMRKGDVTKVN